MYKLEYKYGFQNSGYTENFTSCAKCFANRILNDLTMQKQKAIFLLLLVYAAFLMQYSIEGSTGDMVGKRKRRNHIIRVRYMYILSNDEFYVYRKPFLY